MKHPCTEGKCPLFKLCDYQNASPCNMLTLWMKVTFAGTEGMGPYTDVLWEDSDHATKDTFFDDIRDMIIMKERVKTKGSE